MDEGMEQVEIMFAQRLASGEPTIRQRALKHLREYIIEGSKSAEDFSSDSLARLCKGLHYAMWMQDKMLLQEELAEQIFALFECFCTPQQLLNFVSAFITVLSKEWPTIDRWRMDKFLMLMRRMMRTLFVRLAKSDWDAQLCEQYHKMLRKTLICADSKICDSLKFHCASVWLDELDSACSIAGKLLNGESSLPFIRPYIQLLSESISDTFFQTICADIFDTILCEFEQCLNESGKFIDESEDEQIEDGKQQDTTKQEEKYQKSESEQLLKFDYRRIGELLFDAGKQQKVIAKRRKRMYSLSKRFENSAKGLDPFPSIDVDFSISGKKRRRKRE